MIIYCVLYSLFIATAVLDFFYRGKRLRIQFVWAWVVILTVFWGIRWNCGTDWDNYYDVFLGARMSNVFSYTRGLSEPIEPGFVFLNALVKTLGGNYTCFLLLFSFLMLYFFARAAIKYTKHPIIAFIYLVISIGVIFPSRQSLAMGISSCAIPYMLNRKFLKYILLILLGATIHISVIVLIPFYFIRITKLKSWIVFLVYVLSFGLGDFLSSAIDSILNYDILGSLISIRLKSYSQTVSSIDDDFSSRGLMSILLSVSFLIYYIKKKYNKSRILLLRYSFFGYFTSEIIRNVFMQTMRDFMRLELFFRPYSAILFADAFGEMKSRNHKIVACLFFVLLMTYYFAKMLTGTFSNEYLPYKSIF